MQVQQFLDGIVLVGQATPDVVGYSTLAAKINDMTQQNIGTGTGPAQINCWNGNNVRYLPAAPSTFTISGSPTGGTVSVTVNTGGNSIGGSVVPPSSLTTAPIAYNASTSVFEAALEALNPAWAGLLVTTGSAGAWVVTPDKSLSPISFTVTNALTGGSSPNFVVTNAQLANPTTAPTFGSAATTGGTLLQNTTIYVTYAYYNATGETKTATEATYTVPSGTNTNTITLTAPALPSGATGVNVYVGSASGREAYVGQNAANTYVITGLPASGAKMLPQSNGTVFTSETINLTSSLVDGVQVALAFKGISCIHVENPSTTNTLDLFGGASTFAGPLSIASTTLKVPPALVLNGIPVPTPAHLPAYSAGGHWKVVNGVNDLLVVGTHDPFGVAYALILPGVR